MTASSVTCPNCTDDLGQAETSEEAASLQQAHEGSCKGDGNPNQPPAGS